MTCLEKYLQEHPNASRAHILEKWCPNGYGMMYHMDDPEYCPQNNGTPECVRCWNREYIDPKSTPTAEEPHIKDSGSRQEFSTGAVRDIQKGKGRCDLMPLDVVANIVGEGDGQPDPIITYIAHFQTSGDTGCLYLALERFAGKAFTRDNMGTSCCHMCLEVSKHFEEGAEKYGEGNWQKGLPVKCYINSAVRHYLKWLRGDADEPHDRAFCWNVICAIWTCKHKPELNDYGLKECPVCGDPLPHDAKFCGNCSVHVTDPDEFLCEHEEEF